jgi:ABC-2 type transport system ATP-binding protein
VPEAGPAALLVDGLSVSFGRRRALDGLTLQAATGALTAVLGPNGAGKTTLLRCCTGLVRSTSGRVQVLGERPGHPGLAARVGLMPQSTGAWSGIRAGELLHYLAGLYARPHNVDALVERLDLAEVVRTPYRRLSGGQQQAVNLAAALVGRPELVFLDELTQNLDPVSRRHTWDVVRRIHDTGTTVVLVTHDVAEAEHALERVAILSGGRVIAQGRPAELKAGLSHRTRLEIVVAETGPLSVAAVAADLDPDARIRGRRVSAWVPADEAMRRLEKIMSVGGEGALEDVRLVTPTLEDVYLELQGRMLEEDEAE